LDLFLQVYIRTFIDPVRTLYQPASPLRQKHGSLIPSFVVFRDQYNRLIRKIPIYIPVEKTRLRNRYAFCIDSADLQQKFAETQAAGQDAHVVRRLELHDLGRTVDTWPYSDPGYFSGFRNKSAQLVRMLLRRDDLVRVVTQLIRIGKDIVQKTGINIDALDLSELIGELGQYLSIALHESHPQI
jgi:hypothetical protein